MVITRGMKERAKRETLLVWDYLYKHPEIIYKAHLPSDIFDLIVDDKNYCPLCTLYLWYAEAGSIQEECGGCPLTKAKDCCLKINSSYAKWVLHAEGNILDRIHRQFAMRRIIKTIKNWNTSKEA